MPDKNQQFGVTFYAIIIACIISFLVVICNNSSLTIFSNDNDRSIDIFSGYYEADPYFLDLSNLKNMSIIMKRENECEVGGLSEYKGKLMWLEEEENVEEIDITLEVKKIINTSLYKKDCFICMLSDVDHPLTNRDIKCSININSGEMMMYDTDNSVLLASFIKDNSISLYLNK